MSHSSDARKGGFFKFVFGKKSIEGRERAKGSVGEGIEKTKGALIMPFEMKIIEVNGQLILDIPEEIKSIIKRGITRRQPAGYQS